jgi:hypothetical protein
VLGIGHAMSLRCRAYGGQREGSVGNLEAFPHSTECLTHSMRNHFPSARCVLPAPATHLVAYAQRAARMASRVLFDRLSMALRYCVRGASEGDHPYRNNRETAHKAVRCLPSWPLPKNYFFLKNIRLASSVPGTSQYRVTMSLHALFTSPQVLPHLAWPQLDRFSLQVLPHLECPQGLLMMAHGLPQLPLIRCQTIVAG